MATDQHQPSALDGFKLELEESPADLRISSFALRKMAKENKKAMRGPNVFKQIAEVYAEVIFA